MAKTKGPRYTPPAGAVKPRKVQADDFTEKRGDLNAYVCEKCKHVAGVILLDAGVTPASMACRIDDCSGRAWSMGYPQERPVPEFIIKSMSHEWFRPSRARRRRDPRQEVQDYFDAGGLELREITQEGRDLLSEVAKDDVEKVLDKWRKGER